MPFKSNEPYLSITDGKIDPLSEIRNAGIVTNGQVFWVKSASDSDYTTLKDQVGAGNFRDTPQDAIDLAVSDRNDYVLVTPTDGGTVRALGTAIDINEDRVHMLGVGGKPPPMAYNGLTFRGYVAASGIDTELVSVTGAGVELGGLKFLGTSGTAAGGTITSHLRLGTAASGTPHDFRGHDLQVESTQAAAANGTAPIVLITGDVATGISGIRFDRSWIGNASWAPTPVVSIVGTAGPERPQFHDTTFVMDAQATTDAFFTGGTGATGYIMFKDCEFINVESGTACASVYSGIALADNPVLFRNCVGVNVTQLGSGAEFYKSPVASGTSAALRDYQIAVGTAALTPV